MTYDIEALEIRVKKRRTEFIISATVSIAITLLAAALAIAIDDTTYRFVFAVTALISLFYAVRSVKKYRPVSLFSKEIRGINIEEHEFVTLSRGPVSRSYNIIYPSYTRGRRIQSRVYIKCDDGSVKFIDGIYKAQTDVYEIGDELCRPSGAVYPIILNRDVDRMPCPDCGRVNSRDESECTTCGLKIVKCG